MSLYSAGFAGVPISAGTTNATQSLRTIVSSIPGAQGNIVRVYEIFIAGEAGSSTVIRMVVNRPSANPTGAVTNQAPEKMNPASPAAGAQYATIFGTLQSALSNNDVLTPTFNAFGGIVRWVAPPDSQVYVVSQAAATNTYLDFRSRSGTATLSGHILVEEL